MELWIPSQTLDIHNIYISPFQSPPIKQQSIMSQKILIAPLKYIDNSVILNTVVILSPPLEVIHHDPHIGRLVLNVSNQHFFATKMQTLHSYLATSLCMNQQTYFGFTNPILTIDFFKKMIHPLIYNKRLTLFMGSSSRTVQVHKEDGTIELGLQNGLQQGQFIRVAFQLQGISILMNPSLTLLQTLTEIPTDISGIINICKIRFQQAVRGIFIMKSDN